MNTNRIEAFADGVFAFAFTLLVLDFHAPERTDSLFPYLFSLWPQLLAYAISSLLIGLIWANHRAMFVHIKRTDRLLVFLSTLLMADVAFLPFPTSLLAKAISSGQGLTPAAFFYGMVLAVGGVFFNALWFYARQLNPEPVASPAATHARSISFRYVLGPLLYLAAALCAFLSAYLSIALYLALIVFFWMPGRAEDRLGET